MPKIRTCLWFDTQAEEAARFYTELIDNSELESLLPGPDGSTLMASFRLGDQRFQALNGGKTFQLTEACSIVLECYTQEDADRYWYALLEGGVEQKCGWLKDRFGLSWQVIPKDCIQLLSDPKTAAAAHKAMLTMTRLDADEMRKAADETA